MTDDRRPRRLEVSIMLNPDSCGNASGRRQETAPAVRKSAADVLDELAAAHWVRRYEAAWLAHDWAELERHLAADVILLSPGMRVSVAGREAALAHMRAMLRAAQVHEYNTTDLRGRSAGGVGIVSYHWELDWTVRSRRRQLRGQDVLLLRAAPAGWQLLRRLPVQP
ncbi:MAG TPA: nuclear transport factor 2 family protein [Steroidobacteraceae bacterium]|nr:nuclear transport factor 2 family protein [Steroidobacteraceae bacterium]